MHCDENNSEGHSLTDELPTTNPTFLPNSTWDENHTINFQNGFTDNCLDKIIQHQETHVDREIIKKHQEDGNDSKDEFLNILSAVLVTTQKLKRISWLKTLWI